MRKVLRWGGIAIGAAVALLIAAAAILFFTSERVLREVHEATPERLAAPSPAERADAPRQAQILGCVTCHGDGLRGKVMFDTPGVARVFAPNLTQVAARASDQQLAAAIRQGIGHDGSALFVMPSPMYSRLSDSEVAALIGWIRAQPRVRGGTDGTTVGPMGRVGIALGKFRSAPDLLEEFRTKEPIDLGPGHARGRRLAATVCSECHGAALFGNVVGDAGKAPDLNVVAGYGLDQFRTLLRTGKTPAGNKLGLMEVVARKDLSHMNDAEIEALYDYLIARAKRLPS